MPSRRPPIRVLVPFQCDWEGGALANLERTGEIVLHRVGLDLRRTAQSLRLAWFDAPRFVDHCVRRFGGRVDAVWSGDEQFGCLIAAAIADRLGLPGASPRSIVRAQHKLLMRRALSEELAESTVAAAAVPYRLTDRRQRDPARITQIAASHGLQWPLFAKPMKGTYSILARRVESATELAEHLSLSRIDRFVLSRLTRPFEALASLYEELPCPADSLLLEQPLRGHQVNVDGYALHGELCLLGIIDEWMYEDEVEGARHFAGFTYPSRLDAEAQKAAVQTAFAAVRAVGFDHGMFNVELFVREDGAVHVIEINPRAAGQFASLYRDVDGVALEHTGIWLAAGRDPRELRREAPHAGAAASIVYRRFDGRPGARPSPAGQEWLSKAHPRACLWLQPVSRREAAREYRWLGSHRFAVLNCAGENHAALQRIGDECGRRLFDAVGPRLYDSSAAVRKPEKTSAL